MDFAYPAKVEALRARVSEFMDRYVLPNNTRWRQEVASGKNPPPVVDDQRADAGGAGVDGDADGGACGHTGTVQRTGSGGGVRGPITAARPGTAERSRRAKNCEPSRTPSQQAIRVARRARSEPRALTGT